MPRRSFLQPLPLGLLALPLGACAARLPAPAQPQPQTPAGDPAWFGAWEELLQRHVDDRGQVDFDAIAAAPAALEAVVGAVGAEGPANAPARFPTPAHVLAYHINAYNALAMHGVIRWNNIGRLTLLTRAGFFAVTRHRMERRSRSLLTYEDDVIRPLGEPRIHFALNCMARGCPRLPREAFRAATLEAQLSAATREFCEDPAQIRLDTAARRVLVSEIFSFFTVDFVPAHAPSLAAYINRWRATPLPEGWALGFHPYDWTISHQARRGDARA